MYVIWKYVHYELADYYILFYIKHCSVYHNYVNDFFQNRNENEWMERSEEKKNNLNKIT